MGVSTSKKINRIDTRLLVTLLLTIMYPVCCATLYAAFIFLIVPGALVQFPALIYWLVACGIWLALLATILPLMSSAIRMKAVVVPPGSEIDLTKITAKGSSGALETRSLSDDKSSDQSEDDSSRIEITLEKKSPEKERIVKSNDFLNVTDYTTDEFKVTVHAEECRNGEIDNENDEDFRQTVNVIKDRKNISFEAISEQDEMEGEVIQQHVKKTNYKMEREDLLPEECVSFESEVKKRPHMLPKLDVSDTECVYQCSSPVSPADRQSNTVFIYVKNEDD